MTVTASSRQRLDQIRERSRAARARRNRVREQLDAAVEADDEQAAAVAQLALDDVAVELETAEQLERQMLSSLAGLDNGNGFGGFSQDATAHEALRQLAQSNSPIRSDVHIGEFKSVEEVMNLTGRMLAMAGTSTVPDDEPRRGGFMGIVNQPQVPLTLLDFFPTQAFDGRVASFMVRQGGIANAAVQAEGAVKAAADLTYIPQDVEAVTVASWVKAKRQDLADIDTLQTDMEQALTYGVLHEVESLLVDAITGATGVGAPDVTGDASVVDKLLTAVGILISAGVLPNFIALHPTDLTAVQKEREGTDGAYIGGSPWAVMPPVVPSAALTAGEALVGDSRIAAALGVRQGITALVGTSDDDHVRNRVTILLEGRWAPMVTVPGALSLVDLSMT
jgi:hypothetical protein